MKHIYIIIALFFLVGCEHEPLLSDEAVAVRLIPSLNDRAPGDTRVINQTWQTTDIVGVSIDNGTAAYDGTAYKTYKPSASGTSVTLNPTADHLYYPVDGSSVTFRAFCPNATITSNEVTYSAFTTQNNSAAMQAVDLVYHKGATGSKSSPTVNMQFEHRFSKVVINVTRGASVTNDLGTLAMTLTGMPRTAKFNVSTGALGALSNTGAITPFHENNSTTGKATAIVPPHKYTGRTITFKVGSLDYSYAIPDDFEFKEKLEYTFNFTLTPTAPILTSTAITPWNSGTIAWDGKGHSLTAPAEVLHYKEATTGNIIVIKTDLTGTPTIAYSTNETTVTGSLSSWLTQAAFTQTKATSPYEWTLTYNVAANGTGSDRSPGYIHTTVGGMKVVTKVTQSKDAEPLPIATYVNGNTNCLMVPPGSAIVFPLTRPVEATESIAGPESTFTVEKLWDDTAGGAVSRVSVTDGKGADAHVTVVAGKNPGNALIAVKVGGVIAWSYHIWVTDYVPYSGNKFTNIWNTNKDGGKNFVFMDRNLGATAAGFGRLPEGIIIDYNNNIDNYGTGLFYQWGRKDPFPATGRPNNEYQPGGGMFKATTTSAELGTIANTIRNPDEFYGGISGSNNDWLFAARNLTLWGYGTNSKKTIYDPCPAGWRVPVWKGTTAADISNRENSPWFGFADANQYPQNLIAGYSAGYQWGANAAYPAAGMRQTTQAGQVSVNGESGNYWSAISVSSSSGYVNCLKFDYEKVYVAGNTFRACGCSVRCVQE